MLKTPMPLFAVCCLLLAACSTGAKDDADASADGGDASASHGGSSHGKNGDKDSTGNPDGAVDQGDAGGPDGGPGTGGDGSGGSGGDGGSGPIDTDGDPNWPPPPASKALRDLPGKLAGAVCEALSSCLGPIATEIAFEAGDCVARTQAEIEDGEFVFLQASIDTGRIKFSESAVSACVDAYAALACDVRSSRRPAACETLLAGQVPEGGACVLDDDCAGDAFCDRDVACPGACTMVRANGDACSRAEQCASGLECNDGKCSTSAVAGQACGGGSAPPCHLGAYCAGEDTGKPGKCKAEGDLFLAKKDAACDPAAGVLCAEGLACTIELKGVSVSTVCRARVGSGAACHAAIAPPQCPSGEYCPINFDPMDLKLDATCAPLPKTGETCGEPTGSCAAGNTCDADGKCRAIGRLGDACSADGLCYSGHCKDGYCVTPDVCRLECGDTACDASESCDSCAKDCGACPKNCGNDKCDGDETCTNCEADCGTCTPTCGDNSCAAGETCKDCEKDCGACGPTCGDNTCDPGETCKSCDKDCGACAPPYSGPCDSDAACAPGEHCVQTKVPGFLLVPEANYGYCAEGCSAAAECSGDAKQTACSSKGDCRLQCNTLTGIIDPSRACPKGMACISSTCTWKR